MNSDLISFETTVKQLETDFDKLREDISSKLNACSDCIKLAKQLCDQAREIKTVLETKLVNATEEEKEWKNIKVKLATTSIQGRIILDVGGEKFITCVETLTREKNTFFTALFSSQWQLERDPNDGSVFIDRNGKIFTYILEYLRANTVPDKVMKDEILCKNLFIEGEYFRLKGLLDILTDTLFPNGTLLKLEQKKKLNEFYGKRYQRWELIYKATRDGFDVDAFHSRCNNKGPTMTIIHSTNNFLFGGYTTISWTSDNSYRSDDTAFLFTLVNPHNIPPTKYIISDSKTRHAVYHNDRYGPTFGSGHDIYVANNSHSNNSSYIHFPKTYVDTTGKLYNTFTGFEYFTAYNIEVFKLS
ncbi:unnamed protein product [Rotaria magnacalcarata]|uniref:TLDc domain-containing protein n=4 Tax=Rotaria magnacalcarata TaxID=392030 RepID=A0A816ZQY9_9BILA|nr:unnamed protein product [Rotaria magnacalcarata]CAF1599727.1 unnamed protein product [Rotaria magnacalcarata]CAF2227652.1 unnamed protein product [Rotaria magnacalcarata]CAF4210471.1 unnamed protein product [Rotaria magnacalcarata]